MADFNDVASWAAYDAGDKGVGLDPVGYDGAVFDGQYVYFAPLHNGAWYHGEVLRYDAAGGFADRSSWASFDPGAGGVGDNPDGYSGGVFDGRYVYFVPHRRSITDFHSEVLRFDTQGPFDDTTSWLTFDPANHGVSANAGGYSGGVFDGQYVYFVPNYNGSYDHGEVLRYDTAADFTEAAAWDVYDPGSQGVGDDPDGYAGAVFDGRYVYFVPFNNGSDWHGEVLRYDTAKDFSTVSSWVTYDPGANGAGDDADGYAGGVFDGRYVYFVPFHNGTGHHGEVLRYDTEGDFSQASSWTAFDAGDHGVGDDPDGYVGGVFDGRYVYFAPDFNGSDFHGEVLRYDTQGGFADASSWSTFDAQNHGPVTHAASYYGGVFDGRHVYFVPNHDAQQHGDVLRFDTVVTPSITTVSGWGVVVMTVCVLGAGTVGLRRDRLRRT